MEWIWLAPAGLVTSSLLGLWLGRALRLPVIEEICAEEDCYRAATHRRVVRPTPGAIRHTVYVCRRHGKKDGVRR